MEELKDLDKLFKEGLQNAHITPPAGVWESIASSAAAVTSASSVTSVWIVALKWGVGALVAATTGSVGYRTLVKQPDVAKQTSTVHQPAIKTENANKSSVASGSDTETNSLPQERKQALANKERNTKGSTITVQETGNEPMPQDIIDHGTVDNRPPLFIPPPKDNDKPANGATRPTPIVTPPAQTQPTCVHSLGIVPSEINGWGYAFEASGPIGNVKWDFGDGNGYSSSGYLVSYQVATGFTGTLHIKAFSSNEAGCKDSAIYELRVDPSQPFVPNCFTPNGDGYNDDYYIGRISNPVYFDLSIYDLYNRPVFKTSEYTAKWNGVCGANNCPAGRYKMILVYQLQGQEKPQTITSFIQLIRDEK